MDSHQAILRAVRRGLPAKTEYPTIDTMAWTHYPDRVHQFAEVLESVGGQCMVVSGLVDLNAALDQLPAYAAATKICSAVAGVGKANVQLDEIQDPHALEDVDYAILPGEFGVAENGAVWLTDTQLKHRIICFIPQHIALVVRAENSLADAIVDHMHEAYRRVAIDGSNFGLFMSGPSKTADIEQSLVIGAHGPRSLTVFLLHGSG